MKSKLYWILTLFLALNLNAQESKFDIEANFPIAIGDNFLGDNYNGIIDLGINYRFLQKEILNLGVSANFGFFKNTKSGATDLNQLFDVTIIPIQPRLFAEFNIPNLEKFHPQIGIGYSILIFNADWADNRDAELPDDIDDSEGGFNFNLGIAYDLSEKFYLQAQYDFVKIGVENGVPDISYNTNINILKFGIGYRL
ncbi:outer membrane beta-barrel protein [Psychroflexus tropicus]|uniref:outer membrane beta-barrel protein n=1 Tax=Psychroflexus tropicus TaxID=197345 RepID=UPI00037FABFC|nr:outer membrane beta-barrel protein [Psychroflexus tropicus]